MEFGVHKGTEGTRAHLGNGCCSGMLQNVTCSRDCENVVKKNQLIARTACCVFRTCSHLLNLAPWEPDDGCHGAVEYSARGADFTTRISGCDKFWESMNFSRGEVLGCVSTFMAP